jgi:hypothetical protein
MKYVINKDLVDEIIQIIATTPMGNKSFMEVNAILLQLQNLPRFAEQIGSSDYVAPKDELPGQTED